MGVLPVGAPWDKRALLVLAEGTVRSRREGPRPLYYQTGPGETDVGVILLESFSVGGKLLPEYLDISGVTVRVSPVERNGRSHRDRLEQTSR